MLKFQFLRSSLLAVLIFCFFANFSLLLSATSAFAHGGIHGVAMWINHVEDRFQFEEVGPGSVRLVHPIVKHIYLRFILGWLVLVVLPVVCIKLRGICGRKLEALEARRNAEKTAPHI